MLDFLSKDIQIEVTTMNNVIEVQLRLQIAGIFSDINSAKLDWKNGELLQNWK